ncbi:MAG: zinc ribbon domain-containing protein [Dehalococcoidia bacterium]|nr:zinc ribbon domain-containing protein [Dehalococcoidia bacterium]MDW8119999.1 zinc ribbon domain-containing protein [Chloroflexota bacterium]
MPIYEYRCRDCQRKSTFFFRSFAAVSEASSLHCEHCGSPSLQRLFSPVAVHRSWGSSLDASFPGEEMLNEADEDNPEAMEEWGRKIKGALTEGEDTELDEWERAELGLEPEEPGEGDTEGEEDEE